MSLLIEWNGCSHSRGVTHPADELRAPRMACSHAQSIPPLLPVWLPMTCLCQRLRLAVVYVGLKINHTYCQSTRNSVCVQSEHAESSLSRGRCLQCRSQINIRRFEFRGFPFDFMHLLAIITGTDEFRGVAPGYPPKRRPWSLLIVWENWEGSKATCSPGLFFLQYYYFRWQTE